MKYTFAFYERLNTCNFTQFKELLDPINQREDQKELITIRQRIKFNPESTSWR